MMTFKQFLNISEEQSGTDKGLMGFPVASTVRKPSDGQPFKNFLNSISGQTPRGNSGSSAAGPSMMKKKMGKK